MSSSEKKKGLAVFAIISILGLVFWLIYYVSTDAYKQRTDAMQEQAEAINRLGRSRITDSQVLLRRNERLEIGRTAIIYRGLEGNSILVDLFLLDLDPEQGFLRKIPKKEAKKRLVLGGVEYRLVSVNDKVMMLKLLKLSNTP